MIMLETKGEIKERLQADGRWKPFVAERERLKADGVPAGDAWKMAAEKFPWLSPTQIAKAKDVPRETSENIAGKGAIGIVAQDNNWTAKNLPSSAFTNMDSTDTRAVIQWVFDNIGIEDLSPKDAPSSGAWFLLQEVRSFPELRREFYKTIFPKILPTKSQLEEMLEKFADDGRKQFGIIDTLQRAIEERVSSGSAEAVG
jgi:hypothetical protein